MRLTLEEVAKHKSQEDAWTVLHGKVYNMSPYMNFHPGGIKQLMKGAGKDSTQLFMAIHAWVNAEYMLDACYIGDLER
ncbi:cytochrome b5 [Blastocladiella britannica]|nr:cytochrome b5 [Blastocladiella britannica]